MGLSVVSYPSLKLDGARFTVTAGVGQTKAYDFASLCLKDWPGFSVALRMQVVQLANDWLDLKRAMGLHAVGKTHLTDCFDVDRKAHAWPIRAFLCLTADW